MFNILPVSFTVIMSKKIDCWNSILAALEWSRKMKKIGGGQCTEQTVMNTFTDFARLTNCNVTVVFAR